jgi:2-polyprenyl-6-methoxyphenol hydroxylase-like FAD-dependent oxidoreductase
MRLWLQDPDGAAQFPNEDDLTVMVVGAHRSRLGEFRADLEGSYMAALAALPDTPDLTSAERASKVIGKLDVPNVIRPAAQPGVAFVGDAALATDPLFGIGCSWAFQSAEWLVDETAPVLHSRRELDAALGRYRRRHLWRLGPHHFQIADFSTGRKMRRSERVVFRAAAGDPVVARAVGELMALRDSPLRLLNPRLATHMVRGYTSADPRG